MMLEEAKRVATLEALAAVRALVEGRDSDAGLLIEGAVNPKAVGLMACGLAASALGTAGIDAGRLLDHLTSHVIAND